MRLSPASLFLACAGAGLFAGCQAGNWPASHKTPVAAASAQASGPIDPNAATQMAPDVFKARFSTTKGDFVLEVHRAWAPKGADRFYNLVKLGYYDGVPFFRVIDGFMVQFGIPGDPALSARWRSATIPDDHVGKQSNLRGFVTFAMGGPNSRTTQLFINYVDNSRLDGMGFPPIGKVVLGMDVVDSLYKVGEGAPEGPGPSQGRVQMQGNAYLHQAYPQLDYVKTARLEP
jgi:peptidyl-prolyl cis-trans isomerase A (cyclophilin A)